MQKHILTNNIIAKNNRKETEGGRTNQKRVVLGKQIKIFEIVHRYIEKIFVQFNNVIRGFSFVRKQNNG